MKYFFSFFLLIPFFFYSQEKIDKPKRRLTDVVEQPRAKHEQYKIISHLRDTTFIDSSLTIKSDYKFNYLKRDNFGLLPFANEGQTYATLDFSQIKNSSYPEFGFKAKHFNYLEVDDIQYFSVATPLTELYFKTVMEQGQSVDALISLNTTERFNFSIAYKGLRSLGKFINQLSSNGNFRFTSSYFSKNNKYLFNAHFTGQDLLNGENGGIVNTTDFEGDNPTFRDRARIQVYLTDAKSFMRGKRFFIDHSCKLTAQKSKNPILVNHQFIFENKYFEFNQQSLSTSLESGEIQRFGQSYLGANINDQTRFTRLFNKLGLSFQNNQYGKFNFFVENFNSRHLFDKVLILDSGIIPNLLEQNIIAIGGQYNYNKGNWIGSFFYNKAISSQTFSTTEASIKYSFDSINSLQAKYSNLSKLPDNNFILNQSSYIAYNWNTNFDNEKVNTLDINLFTKWINLVAQASIINDYLYFSNDDVSGITQIISPKQYENTINYFSLKASKEIKYKKWSLDNTFLFQNVTQDNLIINVPKFITRNSFYFTDNLFKKAMFLQTGFTVNFFSKYFADDYNPVLSEFFTQQQSQIGATPFIDFFVNARVKQTRIFFKAEHLNSGFSGTNYYTAPNYPYRDFMIRFGLVWNFFQ